MILRRTRTTQRLHFKKTILNHMPCYISGIYKCVNYGGEWFAFFIPKGWECWGNSCEYNSSGIAKSQTYKTLAEAKAACSRHQAANQ